MKKCMSNLGKADFSGKSSAETLALCQLDMLGCELTMSPDGKIYVDGRYFTDGAAVSEGAKNDTDK